MSCTRRLMVWNSPRWKERLIAHRGCCLSLTRSGALRGKGQGRGQYSSLSGGWAWSRGSAAPAHCFFFFYPAQVNFASGQGRYKRIFSHSAARGAETAEGPTQRTVCGTRRHITWWWIRRRLLLILCKQNWSEHHSLYRDKTGWAPALWSSK